MTSQSTVASLLHVTKTSLCGARREPQQRLVTSLQGVNEEFEFAELTGKFPGCLLLRFEHALNVGEVCMARATFLVPA